MVAIKPVAAASSQLSAATAGFPSARTSSHPLKADRQGMAIDMRPFLCDCPGWGDGSGVPSNQLIEINLCNQSDNQTPQTPSTLKMTQETQTLCITVATGVSYLAGPGRQGAQPCYSMTIAWPITKTITWIFNLAS